MKKNVLIPMFSALCFVGCKNSNYPNDSENKAEKIRYDNVSVSVLHPNNSAINQHKPFEEISGDVMCEGERALRNFKIKPNETIQIIKDKKCKYQFKSIKYIHENYNKTLEGLLVLDLDSALAQFKYTTTNSNDKRNIAIVEAVKEKKNKLILKINEPSYGDEFVAQIETNNEDLLKNPLLVLDKDLSTAFESVKNNEDYKTSVGLSVNTENIVIVYMHDPLQPQVVFNFGMRSLPAGVKKYYLGKDLNTKIPHNPTEINIHLPAKAIKDNDNYLFLLTGDHKIVYVVKLKTIPELRSIFNYRD